MTRVCAICGAEFTGRWNQITCSQECRVRMEAERAARISRERRSPKYYDKRATTQPALSFADIFAEQARIRREEGVYLTYGQVVERVEKR